MEGGSVIFGGACGEGVIIDSYDGHRYTYCHGTNPLVSAGQRVTGGQPIMISGYSGSVYPPGPAGAHLHLQIQRGFGTGPFVCPQVALHAWARNQGVAVSTLPAVGCVS